jgi:16S rRNA (adenine1518-N6/adenine1519-N6)-dimethyltransferase
VSAVRPPRHRARKRFGQHFLEPAWARKVVAAIGPEPGDAFLEIGPGSGALTLPLAESGVPVLAVEIDRDLVAGLAPRLPANVRLIEGHVLETDVLPELDELVAAGDPARPDGAPQRLRVVGNLPYNLSTPILFRLIGLQKRHRRFADATIMLQREVADRLVARPHHKDYGVLTILVGLHADVSRLLDLPPGAFRPPPQVHSSVVRLTFREPAVTVRDPEAFEAVVKRIFTQRRKTLANGLKGFVPDPVAVLERAGIEPRRRAETLDLAELARLADSASAARRLAVL